MAQTTHHSIIAIHQFRGQSDRYWMNAGVKLSKNAKEAISQFNTWLESNQVEAKLIVADRFGSTVEVLAKSDFETALIV